MNERIRELADEARKHFPKTEMSGEFWVFDEGKFAELIVRECAEFANEHNEEIEGVTLGVGQALKKHFGVEE